jgi:mannan endo-1,4-beta-mannosidase
MRVLYRKRLRLILRGNLLVLLFLPLFVSGQADKQAIPAVKRLHGQLHALLEKGVLFGHQDDLAYGVGWKYQPGRSDVRDVCGDYPAVYGWDLGHIELGAKANLDSVPFDSIRHYILDVNARGGINTISWHLNNPGNGGTAWDTFKVVKDILPGGTLNKKYIAWLDKVTAFMLSVKDVPIIFRPFHEHTGSWFWWGQRHCTTAEYKQLWQFTVRYLQSHHVHNLLYAYSAADYSSATDYLERYPGDAYVDIIGTDVYQYSSAADFQAVLKQRLDILEQVAKDKSKIPALTETGYERIPATKWWTETLLPVLDAYKLSYVLTWRNGRPDHYFAPYLGQQSGEDFKAFSASARMLFQQALTTLVLTDKKATAATAVLYKRLFAISGKHILFGHQHTTDYGVGWTNQPGRSDVRDVCGDYPAIYGWDMGQVVNELMRKDTTEAAKIRRLVIAAYARGGTNTFSWHMDNLLTGKNFYDTTPVVKDMLPGGKLHQQFTARLDVLAAFINSLQGTPVIFRPWHEHNGSWFWWGAHFCNKEEYKTLFRFTVTYLRDVKHIHNLIYAYSPDRFNGIEEYLERYPGDEYVDILGFDDYGDFDKPEQITKGIASLREIVQYAQRKNKVPALTETGLEKITEPNWYTRIFNAIQSDPVASRITYMMVWRNAHTGHFYAPYPGHTSVPDFLRFYENPVTWFERDWAAYQ